MNKKILISLSIIGVVAAIAIGGTIAYFSDTETSTGNTFTAGTLNLKVGDNDPTGWNFQIGDIKPGDSGFQEVILQNTGSLDGYLHITFTNLVNDDISCTDPERDVEGGDCGVSLDPGKGELAENLDILIYLDVNADNDFDLGTDTLIYQGKAEGILEGDMFNYSLPVSASRDFRIKWVLDNSIGNIVQTDTTGFDVIFELTQNPKTDIVGDWHFNENGGSVAYDSALEPANNGTIYGATWTSGKYNPALSFDGVDDYVSMGNPVSLQITGSQITLEAWIKPNAFSGQQGIVGKWIFAPNAGYSMTSVDNGVVHFNLNTNINNNVVSGTGVLTANVWNHVVGSYDGSNAVIYVNGVAVKTQAVTGNIQNSVATVFVGYYEGTNKYFNGLIDEVRIYNRALSAAEILAHYQAGL